MRIPSFEKRYGWINLLTRLLKFYGVLGTIVCGLCALSFFLRVPATTGSESDHALFTALGCLAAALSLPVVTFAAAQFIDLLTEVLDRLRTP